MLPVLDFVMCMIMSTLTTMRFTVVRLAPEYSPRQLVPVVLVVNMRLVTTNSVRCPMQKVVLFRLSTVLIEEVEQTTMRLNSARFIVVVMSRRYGCTTCVGIFTTRPLTPPVFDV